MMRALLLVLTCVSTLHAAEQDNYYRFTPERIIDGDSVAGTIELGWNVTLACPRGVRVIGPSGDFDAWESRPSRGTKLISEAEQAKGRLAKQDLEQLLSTADRVVVRQVPGENDWDSFGRPLVAIWAWKRDEWVDVEAYMRGRGHQRAP